MFRGRIKSIWFWQITITAAKSYLKDFTPVFSFRCLLLLNRDPCSWKPTWSDLLKVPLYLCWLESFIESHDFWVWATLIFTAAGLEIQLFQNNYFQKVSTNDANGLEDLHDLFIWQMAGKDLFEWGSKRAMLESRGVRKSFFLLQNPSEKSRRWNSVLLSSFFFTYVWLQSLFWQDISC